MNSGQYIFQHSSDINGLLPRRFLLLRPFRRILNPSNKSLNPGLLVCIAGPPPEVQLETTLTLTLCLSQKLTGKAEGRLT